MKFTTAAIAAVWALALAASSPLARVEAAPVERQELVKRAHSGTATFYYQNGNAGSCGRVNRDSAYIIATPSWYHNPRNCGRKVWVKAGSKTITATIADSCPGCQGWNVDLSVAAFRALAPMEKGVVSVTWGAY